MKSKILLIVEGEVEEPRILGSEGHGLLSLIGADYEIVPFASSIYELFDAYENGEYDDIVSYLRSEKGLKIDDKILSKNAFSAIYLVFDYEPQYHKYSDEKIKKLMQTFNNETEIGKLYINYPMVEAYYHLLKLPDTEYYERKISLDGLNGKTYKKLVNTTTCLKKNKIRNIDLCHIIMHNYNKCKMLDELESNDIDYNKILCRQIELKDSNNEIYVLSTFPLIVIDYNYERAIEMLKLKLKNKYFEIEYKTTGD